MNSSCKDFYYEYLFFLFLDYTFMFKDSNNQLNFIYMNFVTT